jgi:hypothetical protein
MMTNPDPRYFDTEYDDVKNLYDNTLVPLMTFC